MKGQLILLREIKSYFKSPLTFSIAASFSLLSGWIFYNLITNYVDNIQNLPEVLNGQLSFLELVVLRMFGNMNFFLIFMIPILTMKSFAEEKRSRTIDLLFLAKVSPWQIVFSKFFSHLFISLFIILCSVVYVFIYHSAQMFDGMIIFWGHMALILNLLVYLSIGLFCSSLTSNVVVSAILSFGTIMVMWFMSLSLNNIFNESLFNLIKFLSISTHFESVVKADFSLSDLTFYGSLIAFFLYLTKKSVESRNW